jgi:hypothetical protein
LAQPTQPFLQEAKSALRGSVALVLGDRNAASYFNFSPAGVVGSFIAVLIGVGMAGFLPLLFGEPYRPGAPTITVLLNLLPYAGQMVAALFALRQMKRADGFVPYVVATNWFVLASALLIMASILLGPLGTGVVLVALVAGFVSFVNIGRFVVTLKGSQIALLFLAQIVGFFAMAVVYVLLFAPPMPA